MTALADVTTLVSNCTSDFNTLINQGQAAYNLISGNLPGKLAQARAFTAALGQPFTATGADRMNRPGFAGGI